MYDMAFQKYEITNIYKDWINQYYAVIDEIDERTAKILETLSRKSVINISEIARNLNIPVSTVHSTIQKLRRKNILYIQASIDATLLGLKPYTVILYPTKTENAMKILMANKKYWVYWSRGYINRPCYYVRYVIPNGHEQDFVNFLNTAMQLNLISDYELYPTTIYYYQPLSFKNFDFASKSWIFNWNELLNEINNSKPVNNKYLDPTTNTYNTQKLDHIDLKILKALEKDALVSLSEIRRSLDNLTFQTIYYHYINHVIKRNLISNIIPIILRYPYTINDRIVVDTILMFVSFKDHEQMLKFANALSDKMFVISTSRVLSENTLIFYIMLPHTETPEFLNVLNILMDNEIITSYKYAWLDIRTAKKETLPYSQYDTETGTWKWYQEEYLLKLQEPLKVSV
jgi:DNA-binding Lrp family transcriptional regulator